MSSPEKKRKRKTTTKKSPPILPATPQSTTTPNPSLPDDLVLSCLARVSRLYYPTLSLVSKSFRSLIASPELYRIRSSLGRTESCLYVCLEDSDYDPNPRWFTLCRKPNRILSNEIIEKKKKKQKKPKGYVLAAVPVLYSRRVHWSGLVAVGSNIYNIGGPIKDEARSSSVSILDCNSHTWHEGPSMRVERKYPAANVVDGRIYVVGGCKGCTNSSNWMEVFDPKTQTWETVSSSGAKIVGCDIHQSAGIDGKVYVFGRRPDGLAFKPMEGTWERLGEFKWYDSKVRLWRDLKGVKGLPRFARYGGKMADYGGKMAVFWDKIVTSAQGDKEKTVWCAVIKLERRNGEEMWAKVEWQDAVLTVPLSSKLVYALSPTL